MSTWVSTSTSSPFQSSCPCHPRAAASPTTSTRTRTTTTTDIRNQLASETTGMALERTKSSNPACGRLCMPLYGDESLWPRRRRVLKPGGSAAVSLNCVLLFTLLPICFLKKSGPHVITYTVGGGTSSCCCCYCSCFCHNFGVVADMKRPTANRYQDPYKVWQVYWQVWG